MANIDKRQSEGKKGGGSAKIVALANQKGGVGKSTTAMNLSSALAVSGKRVLLIDADPQGNASSGLGVDSRGQEHHLYHCLIGEASTDNAICSIADHECFDLVPTHIDLIGAEIELVSAANREYFLGKALRTVKDKYDYIFIDCPPSLGLLTINALTAADSVIIPMQCEYFALEGLSQLVRTIRLVKNSFNKKLIIEGLLLTMFDRRNRLTFQVAKEVREHFQGTVYDIVIPRNVRLSESPSHGQPVLTYAPGSVGAVSYLNLAKEFLKKQKA